jgi:para-nitrobenzyl esterase
MRYQKIVFAFLALIIITAHSYSQNTSDAIIAGKKIAVVETVSGKLRGYMHKGIFIYKGIPYAEAERFMAPSKPTPWKNTRTAFTYGPVSPIDPTITVNDEFEFPFEHNWGYMNEHCQTLNVWTTAINDGKKRPVMVWLHGGGFSAGSSIEQPGYDGENLSKKGDVVVVSLNHRLNVLGFLDLSAYGDKYKYSPNAGLMDIVAALEWVKQNIAQFGGDPENVTIFGQSGGGGKVTSLMYAPSAKGLFHKAIVESGSYLSNFTESNVSKRVAAELLNELGLLPTQIDSLQKVPYDLLSAASRKAIRKVSDALKAENKSVGGFGLGWGPIHDGTFLPYQLSEPGAVELAKNIPLLVGTTKNEFTPFMPNLRDLTMDQVKENLQKQYGDSVNNYMMAVRKAYPDITQPSNYLDIDMRFRPGAISQANEKSTSGKAPVYMYVFSWQSPVNDGIYKAMHCMEIPFVFNNISRCEEMTGGGKEAYVLADKMSQAWINFARFGNPNSKNLPAWPVYTPASGATMIFDKNCVVKNHYDDELLKFASLKL